MTASAAGQRISRSARARVEHAQNLTPAPAGLKPATFARACSISRTALYQLPEELWPRTVRFGRAVVIVEPPAEWLARVAEIQQAARQAAA